MMASSEIKTKFSIFVMSDREVDYSKFSSIIQLFESNFPYICTKEHILIDSDAT